MSKFRSSSSSRTVFNPDWCNPNLNPEWAKWLKPNKENPFTAVCSLCARSFSLSNMGCQAIKSHEKGPSHIKKVNSTNSQISVTSLFSLKNKNTPIVDEDKSTNTAADSSQTLTQDKKELCLGPKSQCANIQPNYTIEKHIKTYKVHVTKAEITWALRLVSKREAFNSCKDDNLIFQQMFPDSHIVKNFAMGPQKCAYMITYGIGPHFNRALVNDKIKKSNFVVVCFDESLHKVVQKCQMDVHIRLWDVNKQEVGTRFLKSVFMGHSTAEDILAHFKLALENVVPLQKVLQISMDGPNANWKFIRCLEEEKNRIPESPELLEIGSCGLHVVHGAFQSGHKEVKWQINGFLRGIYYLFKDSPARRSDFTSTTGASDFPLRFCQVRWLESLPCVERAQELFSQIKKFITTAKLPNTTSVETVRACMKDKLFECRLAFFKMISAELQPFLKTFQSGKPMGPFLYSSIFEILKSFLLRIVKSDVLANTSPTDLLVIDLKKEDNLLPHSKVDIGFSASRALNQSKASEKEKIQLRLECQKFLIIMVQKLVERSPLKYRFVKGLSSLDPHIGENVAVAIFKICLDELFKKNIIDENVAEKAKREFSQLRGEAKNKLKSYFENFSVSTDRLDTFYVNILRDNDKYKELFEIVKLLLILSHGNAEVEGGFSVNKSILVENLKEESLVAIRQVHDHIRAVGDIMSIEITPALIQSVHSARGIYKRVLEDKKNEEKEKDKEAAVRKRKKIELK